MARMKTGRLTSRTTPPPNESSNQAAWNKYESDVKAYNNYDSDVRSYNEKMKKYNEEMKGQSGGYNYSKFAGGKSGTRRLSSSELSEFNKSQPLESEWVDIPKSYKGKLSEVDVFMSKPKKPVAPVRKEKPDPTNLPLDPMPYKSAGKIATKKGGIKTVKEVSQKADFISPKVNFKPSKRVTPGSIIKTANLRSAKPQVDTKAKPLSGYNKEARQFKAYAGTTATGESHIDKSAQEINQYKNEMKGMRKEYRKEAPSEIRSMGLAATTSEIRQARKAERFVKNNNKHFTDKNYGGNIAKDYRESSQNAANRNTMDAKIKAAGNKQKSKSASFNGQMPL